MYYENYLFNVYPMNPQPATRNSQPATRNTMSLSRKYGRTYHYPFSPGTSSDDRLNHDYWEQLSVIDRVVHTEKLDGENTCLNRYGVFARSHIAPTIHPWANYLKERWGTKIKLHLLVVGKLL